MMRRVPRKSEFRGRVREGMEGVRGIEPRTPSAHQPCARTWVCATHRESPESEWQAGCLGAADP
jgi:hypothetical protein